MDMAKYLSDHKGIRLNEQQKQAIDAIEGPTLLLAVPGSGKTTVVVARCANMIINRGINPQNILTLTFSKAAAKDMEKRFHHLFGDRISTPRFMTIHSFGYQVVKYACKIKGEKMPVFIESTDSPVSKKHILRESYRRQNHKFIQEEKLEELSNH
ncbi:MAG TPA: ATP-dependent helicase, partial [Eubacteriaceae bacterium]|nr:ATP-dependent helicase [Eubacteriaceae bacterium]